MNYFKNIFLAGITFLSLSCSPEDSEKTSQEKPKIEIDLATVSTIAVSDLDAYRATVSAQIENNGGSSVKERGVCYSEKTNPDYENQKAIPSSFKGSGEYEVNLSGLKDNTTYYIKAFAKNAKGIAYGNELSFKTLNADVPKFKIGEVKVSGVHDIWIETSLVENGDAIIKELGLVYGITGDLNIENDKVVKQDEVKSKYLSRITELEGNTSYYFKAYAITENDDVYYSDPATFSTISSGDFSYTINGYDENNPVFVRLKEAIENVKYYYNNYTSIKKHVWVNYVPGVTTADANFEGWIRFGSNQSYQQTGTALHEVAHTVGVGTHSKWNELLKDGVYQGTRANEILRLLTQDEQATVKGDGLHFWPFGINGAHEDDGKEITYIINTLIIQGMRADGLPIN
ncbi:MULTISPECIES: hypothetical protein [unclassified Leeuwenhoekiella]|uniref:hypothetical protein n=1 Tax=unclassified Leeuwenhoekiella TaxID=2615029 RepID=UPI000C665555|nr:MULTISPECIES: hypothetical protein [unclassified Leeuwenhoekiella]MAW94678.1 hypothetical protein [Leeuwenhoekiella sp.]MBA82101.1 hypothetical protein [Leeuwenhoekiella sp.]|tara:strand:- start:14677 stop:15879 length:1203 start_codon:yes stop_codon:yes gene_type:complete